MRTAKVRFKGFLYDDKVLNLVVEMVEKEKTPFDDLMAFSDATELWG